MALDILIRCGKGAPPKCYHRDDLHNQLGEKQGTLISPESAIKKNQYLNIEQQLIINNLKHMPPSQVELIAQLTAALGMKGLLALASFYNDAYTMLKNATEWIESNSVGAAGAYTTAKESRYSKFVTSALKYEESLKKIHQAKKSGLPRFQINKLISEAKESFSKLQQQFQYELKKYMKIDKTSNRGNVWSNADRGVNKALSSRTEVKLNFSNFSEFNRIRNFVRNINLTGKGLILLDAGARLKKVVSQYNSGKDWLRSMSVEMVSFGVSNLAGITVGSMITGALTTMLVMTPWGWAIAIVGGLIASFTTAFYADKLSRSATEYLYDHSTGLGI